MRIFHVSTADDWAEAQRTGRYTTSTRGRTLAEEGFIHASRADQWQGVRERFYAGVTEPLVLLVIDTDRLSAPVVEEPAVGAASGSVETFPHVYGAIEADAVVQVLPLDQPARRPVDRPAPAEPPEQRPAQQPTQQSAAAGPTTPHRPLFSLFLEEMAVRAGAGVVVIVVAVGVGLLVVALAGDFPGLVTMLALLVVGGVAAAVVLRRREARLAHRADSTS